MNFCDCGNEIGKKSIKCRDCVTRDRGNQNVFNHVAEKNPPKQLDEEVSRAMIDDFIKQKKKAK